MYEKENEIIGFFKSCLKEPTKVKKLEELYDSIGYYNGEIWKELNATIAFENKYDLSKISIENLVKYWMHIIISAKDPSLIFEVYNFLPWLLEKNKKIDINSDVDFVSIDYIELENIFIAILNNLDRMTSAFKVAEELILNNFKWLQEYYKNKFSKEFIEYLNKNKGIKSYSFKKNLYNPVIKESVDIAEFYIHYLYEIRNQITHRSKWTYLPSIAASNKVKQAIFDFSIYSGVNYNFSSHIKYAIIYSIVITQFINEEFIKISRNLN